MPIINASGLPSAPFAYTTPLFLFDWRTGRIADTTITLSELTKNPLFKEEIDRYIKFWNSKFADKAVVGYKVCVLSTGVWTVLTLFGLEWR